jgi:predicted RNA-binding Zn-ribbon protein involved in translation (DUF1610 family)
MMATRERYSVSMTCPKCGKKATAAVEEKQSPGVEGFHDSPDRSLSLWLRGGDWPGSPKFWCGTCGAEAIVD